MPRPAKLLVSARDTGAAHNLARVIAAAIEDRRFVVTVVADGPARDVLARAGVGFEDGNVGTAGRDDQVGIGALAESGREVLQRHKPDAVLCGSSGPDAGLDEALLLAADSLPTFVVQDYWGDINPAVGPRASLYFVVDEYAAAATAARGAVAEIAGPVKYDDYGSLDPQSLRNGLRARLGLGEDVPIAAFFGQSLPAPEAYCRTVLGFVDGASGALDQPVFYYRAHPRETAVEIGAIIAAVAAAGWKLRVAKEETTEAWLAGCDLAGTVFSNCGYDLAYLNRASRQPLAVMTYLLAENELRNLYRCWTDLEQEPVSTQGLALLAATPADIGAVTACAVMPNTRSALWQATRKRLPDPTSAASRILDRIHASVPAVLSQTRPALP